MIRLTSEQFGVEASIDFTRGNRVTRLLFHGQNVLREPGIPFLAPWANRMPGGFHADGRYYSLDRELGNLELDAAGIPIHGLLSSSALWEIVARNESSVTSRLEFRRFPDLMAQWPFAHQYEMTYSVADGWLQVTVAITNFAECRMPVAVGFHPYLTIPGVPRKDWRVRVPARLRLVHDGSVLATGQLVPAELPEFVSLTDHVFDSGYTALEINPRFRIEAGGKALEIQFDGSWPVAILWGPPGENFLCVEPMAAPTNGINLHARGLWSGLQWIEPGTVWRGGFRIAGHGF